VVLIRAAGLVLLCNALPIVFAVWIWVYVAQQRPGECVDCNAFVGLFMVVIVGTVAVSLAFDLLLAGVLVLARMRRPVVVGLIAGATGLLLTAAVVLQLLSWLVDVIRAVLIR
jgi:hypothetical protein